MLKLACRATNTITTATSRLCSTLGRFSAHSLPLPCAHSNDSQGLSYTTFSYSDLKLSSPSYTAGDVSLSATLTVANAGSVVGSEVVQLYITLPSSLSVRKLFFSLLLALHILPDHNKSYLPRGAAFYSRPLYHVIDL